MTTWQELYAKKLKQADPDGAGSTRSADPWDDAPAPAQVAKRVGEGVFRLNSVSPERIPLLTNVMHWGYGTGWGIVYAVATADRRASTIRRGATFGAAVWAASYAQLVPMGLSEPPWKYKPNEVALDLSYHLTYGLGVAAAFRALDRISPGSKRDV
jgi:uncharacterized membrane protein YagU involved in acid resistance